VSMAFADHPLIDVVLSTLRRTSPRAGRPRKTDMRCRVPGTSSCQCPELQSADADSTCSQDLQKHLSHLGRHREYDTAMPGGGCHAPQRVRTSNNGIFHLQHLPRATKDQKKNGTT